MSHPRMKQIKWEALDWLNSIGFLVLCVTFFNGLLGNKAVVVPNPLMKEESHHVYSCDDDHLSTKF